MKKKVFYIVACIIFATVTLSAVYANPDTTASASGKAKASEDKVELQFLYNKQKGRASNQFALWIEDSKGNLVKPLFVTRFTGNGGWKKRSDSLPLWAKNVAKDETIDTVTGSTPKGGSLTYTWDLTDQKGTPVSTGEYVYLLEATLRWDKRVLYKGAIKIDGKSYSESIQPEYFGDDSSEREMIENVEVRVIRNNIIKK